MENDYQIQTNPTELRALRDARPKSQNMRNALLGCGFLVAMMGSASAMAAIDMFLKVGDIRGESTDARHKDEIDVLSWSWGESNGTVRIGPVALPKTCIQDMQVTKVVDRATPELITKVITGAHMQDAVLSMVRADDQKASGFLVITMQDVTVTSYSTGGTSGQDNLTEKFTLHFASMEGRYYPQNQDGSYGTPVSWDINGGLCR